MANEYRWEDLQRELLSRGHLSAESEKDADLLGGTAAGAAIQELSKQLAGPAQTPTRPASAGTILGQTTAALSKGVTLSPLTKDLATTSSNFLLKGLTLAPLIRGLFSLFRKEDDTEPVAPVRFSLPAPIRTEAGLAPDGQTVSIDRGAGDRIRTLRQPESQSVQGEAGRSGVAASNAPTQNITVQVNAMDSRSFLDHSEDIARAVREAMLHSHSINDVVNDL
jgi:hypothetical protein